MTIHRMLRLAAVPLIAAAMGAGGCVSDLIGTDAVTNAARTSLSSFVSQIAQAAVDDVFGN